MVRGTKAQERTVETCEKIIKVATEMFATSPYDLVTLRDVAQKANISLALLGYHFENKQNLYISCLLHKIPNIERWRSELLREVDLNPSLEAYVRAFFYPTAKLVQNDDFAGNAYCSLLCRVIRECDDISSEVKKYVKFQLTDIYYMRFKQYFNDMSPADVSWLTHIAHTLLYCTMGKCTSQFDLTTKTWKVQPNETSDQILDMVVAAFLRIIKKYIPST